jgi:hypothetical protein
MKEFGIPDHLIVSLMAPGGGLDLVLYSIIFAEKVIWLLTLRGFLIRRYTYPDVPEPLDIFLHNTWIVLF